MFSFLADDILNSMKDFDLIVIGGGPAGFFGALRFAELSPGASILVLEKSERVLQKVLISGGGRCNLSHDWDDPRDLIRFYPRGGKALLNTFYNFGPRQTIEWFKQHGLRCYADDTGCYFPITDNAQSVIDVLTQTAEAFGIRVWTRAGLTALTFNPDTAQYHLTISNEDVLRSPRVLFATGGTRQPLKILQNFGIPIVPPVPSLFALKLADPECADLAGITVEDVCLSLPGTKLAQRGTLLITHRGFSGPAAINLSAWSARHLKEADYHHPLQVDWLPQAGTLETTLHDLTEQKNKYGARTVVNHAPFSVIPARLWHSLCTRAEITSTTRWADLSKTQHHQLGSALRQGEFAIIGRDAHRAEYVTCGGVDLKSIDLHRFESKTHPGLFFAGEVLDVDGLTGGYNLQNCWSSAWLAASAMANGSN